MLADPGSEPLWPNKIFPAFLLVSTFTATLSSCSPTAIAGAACTAATDCIEGQACVAGLCVLSDGGDAICTTNEQCPQGQVCGAAGICEEPVQAQSCAVTADCPMDQYCNPSVEGGICLPLIGGACREASQCGGSLRCSATPGGVGRCVECLSGTDCPSGQCTMNGSCVPGGGVDAGSTGFDAGSTGYDAGSSGGEDPSCGDEGQRCCGSGSPQPSPCDDGSMSCLHGFPGASDAYCWRRCTPTACTTLENEAGTCHLNSDGRGSCQGTTAYTCTGTSQCQSVYPNGECVYVDATYAYCFVMGCDWQGSCPADNYCSTFDGNLCLPRSLLGG